MALASGPLRAGIEDDLDAGDLVAAESELEALADEWAQAVAREPTADHRHQWALTLLTLGTVERALALPGDAAAHLEQALGLTADPSTRADLRETLALTRQDLGETERAETLLREVLGFRNGITGSDEAIAAKARTEEHLGLLLLSLGRYEEAEELLLNAHRATPAADTLTLARRLRHLGSLHHTLGSHQRAADEFERALSRVPADDELHLALLSDLALARLRLGEPEAARLGFEAAAEGARRLYRDGREPLAVPYWNNLGTFALHTGDLEGARAAFADCLRLLEAATGPDHPALIAPLNNLGVTLQLLGDYEGSRSTLERAVALQARHLPGDHLRVAETARNLAWTALLAGDDDAPDQVSRATRLGLDLLARLVEHGTETERLNFLQRFDLVSPACATGRAGEIAPVLAAAKGRLLDALLSGTAACRVPSGEEILGALPSDAAFVDFCRFTEPTLEPVLRYGAVVHSPGQGPAWVPLGTEEELRSWLDALRARLTWKARVLSGRSASAPPLQMRGILRELHRAFLEAVESALPPGCRTLVVSPDASLGLVPFAALVDGDDRLLCQKYDLLTCVGSARDLLRESPPDRINHARWTLVGISRFPRSGQAGTSALDRVLAHLDDLPGARDEQERLARLAPVPPVLLEDEAATEPRLRGLAEAPEVLHLGTHSFFLASDLDPSLPLDFDRSPQLLYSSGLALHRAGQRVPGSALLNPDDDVLFPPEIARLPLDGTRLVVLASCQSGAGTALAGEGVLGLRRAFQIAGADEVMVSLWPLSDQSSPAFMEAFYRLALATDHPAQALWITQRRALADPQGDDFEAAVLQAAPFILSQKGPPRPVAEVPAEARGPFPWKPVLASLPLALFLLGRLWRRRVAAKTEDRLTA